MGGSLGSKQPWEQRLLSIPGSWASWREPLKRWEQGVGGVLKDPECHPQCLLLARGGKCSDRQSNDFRADFDWALQACLVLQTYGTSRWWQNKLKSFHSVFVCFFLCFAVNDKNAEMCWRHNFFLIQSFIQWHWSHFGSSQYHTT